MDIHGGQRQRLDVKGSDISGSTFDDVNMSGCTAHDVNLSGLRIEGMTINGIKVEDMLAAYEKQK